MTILTRLAVVCALTSAVAVGGTTVASAEQATIKDKRADVISYASDDDEEGTILDLEASTASGVDITRFRVKHGKKSISLTVNVADLAKGATVRVDFRLNSGSTPQGVFRTTSGKHAQVLNVFGDDSCTVPVTTRYGANGYVTSTFKRSCLQSPKKFKAQAYAFRYEDSDDAGGPSVVDLVSATRYRSPSWTPWLEKD